MISVIVNGINYEVPTSWSDVTYSQWQLIQNEKDDIKILSIITTIPIDLLENFNQKQLEKLGIVLMFLENEIDLTGLDNPKYPIDIMKQSWGKRIEAEQLLREKPDDINGIVDCYEVDIQLPIIEVFKIVVDIISQIKIIIERENKELHVEQKREHILAGASMYEQFGVMNSIRSVAQGDILKFDEVLKIPYNMVFMYLKMQKTDTIFQDNYQKVLSRK